MKVSTEHWRTAFLGAPEVCIRSSGLCINRQECQSVNISLLSDNRRKMFLESLRLFLSSMDFPTPENGVGSESISGVVQEKEMIRQKRREMDVRPIPG